MKETKLSCQQGTQRKTITCFVPESWDEVTWQQFADLQCVNRNEDLTQMDKATRRTSIVTGVAVPTLELCDFDEVLSLMSSLSFLSHLADPDLNRAQRVVIIGGQRYHATQLVTLKDITAYDNVELSEALPFEEKASLKMAVFLRPEKPKKLKWYQKLLPLIQAHDEVPELEGFPTEQVLEQRQKLFAQNLTVTQVHDLMAFFLKAAVESQVHIPDYSPVAQALLRQNRKMVQRFGKHMVGKPSGSAYARTLWTMRNFYNFLLTRYFRALSTTK